MSGSLTGRSPRIRVYVGPGAPADVWTWTDDLAPKAGDVRTWYGMLVDATGGHVAKAGVEVAWTLTATGGNATLSAASSMTDARGIATVDCTYSTGGSASDIVTVEGGLA